MQKLNIANLNTPIQKLEKTSQKLGKNIYIKRDDFTGTEISGNKVRKLEYSIKYALDNGYDTVITTGGIQSNHARATACVCSMENLECHLVLRGEIKEFEGNLFLDKMLGANVHVIGDGHSREEAMEELKAELERKGKKVYVIPVGASNAIGSYGYINCYEEIKKQEEDMNIHFDSINIAVGSGGTYAGLWYGNEQDGSNKKIIGYSVDESKEVFKEDIIHIVKDIDKSKVNFGSIFINDLYVGIGYAKATDEELAFYIDFAKKEGIVLDPAYTGKGFRGMVNEIKQGNYDDQQNILFIHTGGLQGYTKEMRDRINELMGK
ncbi:pyridoxal-phosphate dependent enzyme [Virgibacillus dakarensis]|uniref:D-cysteine desulfhydrase n=1 Tax=Lentibacillus populi TaxID=1827502 RepID=A0A9W5X813_9BACI|nr:MULTISPECIES: D-cysteine desulfhydrase family protein [Bacillaceae]MBT2214617.1 D-cysteine desulfhydrase family protein [Virgibacillus dakarensis]MTW87344.1 pyridoxal-phosphate dependent enzyme [Virgibacillus dakarensis]GGB61140.1 D-cysteine desulfhydrase [Lentibacillus populi]